MLYKVEWIVLHPQSVWTPVILQLKPDLKISTKFPPETDVHIVFCTGAPPGSTAGMWNNHLLQMVVATHSPRSKVKAPWLMTRLRVEHALVGGVSDGTFNLYAFAQNLPSNIQPIAQPRRDVFSIVDTTASGGIEASTCTQKPTKIPAVRRTPCGMLSVFGLFPLQARRQKFLVPSVYTTTKWAHRRLNIKEQAHVFDVPLIVLKDLSDTLISKLIDSLDVPLKILISVIPPLLQYCDNASSPTEPIAKRQRVHATPSFASGSVGEARGTGGCFDLDCALDTIPNLKLSILVPSKQHSATMPDHDVTKATKADDAAIPIYIWNDRITSDPGKVKALESFRCMGLRWWKRNLLRSFIRWLYSLDGPCRRLKRKGGRDWVYWHRKDGRYHWISTGRRSYMKSTRALWSIANGDMDAGRECVCRAANSTWWEWLDGSRPFFWKWKQDYRVTIRDGVAPWMSEAPKRWVQPQQCDSKTKTQVKEKLHKVWKVRRYLEDGHVKNLTRFFAVPKGDEDIRMVYDSTVANLNDSLWAPWFAMPTVRDHLRAIGPGSYMADVDIGEMFLNFVMHPDVRPFCGVDLSEYFPEHKKENSVLWVRWSRCCMGLKSSPYNCVQGLMHLAEQILGDPDDANNPFKWKSVEMNLPGSESYDPSLPWVFKCRVDGMIACDIFIYVDDLRPTGPTKEDCWRATRRTAAILNTFGIQDATRKRRPPSQTPGAWAGSIVSTTGDEVRVEVAQDKWLKSKRYINWIIEHHDDVEGIPFKELERIRGFLVYTTRTYPAMVPYLKGIHLTLDGWRKHRDDEGWKYIGHNWEEEEDDLIEESKGMDGPPARVVPVPRLKSDIEALAHLTSAEYAPKRIIRNKKVVSVVYGFGDASGRGFGTGVKIEGELFYRYGEWCSEVAERSSNYRELYNLVLGIQELAGKGKLSGVEMFIFTDNSTAEGAFFRGTSSNK